MADLCIYSPQAKVDFFLFVKRNQVYDIQSKMNDVEFQLSPLQYSHLTGTHYNLIEGSNTDTELISADFLLDVSHSIDMKVK